MGSRFSFSVILLLVSIGASAQVQFRGTNLMEFQWGNLPTLDPKYQSSLFDQLDLSLRYESFGLDTRIEQYYPSFGEDISYRRISQFKFQYKSELLDVEVGNIYPTLGRGLLLRTYEIPSSIWETRGFRVRYGFYRDLLGASVTLNLKDFELKALRGEYLDVTLPPTIEDIQQRRPDLVEGAQATYRMDQHSVGLIFMRNFRQDPAGMDPGRPDSYASFFYEGVLFDRVSVYGELAKLLADSLPITAFDEEAGYGAYAGINFFIAGIGVSLEYKDYQNFSLGTGINDPPTLIKEHTYRNLNRSTHVPALTDESGYQVELYYSLPDGSLLTLNTSRSKNEITPEIEPVFQEYFIEYQFELGEKISVKAFGDYSKDPFRNEDHRYALGSYIDMEHKNLISSLEFEWQRIDRNVVTPISFSNWYAAYTISKASKYSASIVTELTYDPNLLVDQDYKVGS